MSLVRELNIDHEHVILDKEILAELGVTAGKLECRVVNGEIIIRPLLPVQEIDQETLIQRIMAVQGWNREDVERVLATQGAWADAPETEEAIRQLREEAAKWPIPEW
jgi:hypothetical protein